MFLLTLSLHLPLTKFMGGGGKGSLLRAWDMFFLELNGILVAILSYENVY